MTLPYPTETGDGPGHIFTDKHTVTDILRYAYEQGNMDDRAELKGLVDCMELPYD